MSIYLIYEPISGDFNIVVEDDLEEAIKIAHQMGDYDNAIVEIYETKKLMDIQA